MRRWSGTSTGPRLRCSTEATRLLALAVLIAACAAGIEPATQTAAPTTATTTTTVADPISTTPPPPATPTTVPPPTTTTTDPEVIAPGRAEGSRVTVPEGEGPFPAVVLVHGGSWVAGSPASLEPLARHLAGRGFLVVNTAYRLATLKTPSFPRAAHDVACAVRHAAHHPASDGTVALIGHSAGAHLAAVVALDADRFGDGCVDSRPARADLLVGLAGAYDVTALGVLAAPLFGALPSEDPELWASGNPMHLASPDDGVRALLIHGERDTVVPLRFSERFAARLDEMGLAAAVETLSGVDHRGVTDPAVIGEIVVSWITGNREQTAS